MTKLLYGTLCAVLCGLLAGCESPGVSTRENGPKGPAKTSLVVPPAFKACTPKELDGWLRRLHAGEPDLRRRVRAVTAKLMGQPYKLYLLGEFPFELTDADPLHCLEASDCVTFVEHAYAMALGANWREFYLILQRIRYQGGEIGTRTRNHYTIPDWEPNNSWLVAHISEELAGPRVRPMTAKTHRNPFFKKSGLSTDYRDETVHTVYIPAAATAQVADKLLPGDMVQIIRGFAKPTWCGHVGMIGRRKDGTVTFIHSGRPRVAEVPLLEYAQRNLTANTGRRQKKRALFYGFRFLRLRPDPLATLRAREGEGAPTITIGMQPGRPD